MSSVRYPIEWARYAPRTDIVDFPAPPLPLTTVPYVDNDTAVRGEYTPFEPKEDAETFSGTAIEGNEEEELQQERIAGGAVGEARSVLEPLHGVTDYSEGEYVPVYGIA